MSGFNETFIALSSVATIQVIKNILFYGTACVGVLFVLVKGIMIIEGLLSGYGYPRDPGDLMLFLILYSVFFVMLGHVTGLTINGLAMLDMGDAAWVSGSIVVGAFIIALALVIATLAWAFVYLVIRQLFFYPFYLLIKMFS